MKEKIYRFMQGRYGFDSFGRFLLVVSLILFLIFNIIRIPILYIVTVALFVWAYFRMFSRNISSRARENQLYLNKKSQIIGFFKGDNKKIGQDRTHKIFTCPQCGQKLRVPKGKGRIEICCRRCNFRFVKRT